MGLFSSLFKSYSEKQIAKIIPTVDAIEALADKFAALTDKQMLEYTDILKGRLAKGETLDDILPEAFALVREADDRVLGKRPFRVQLMGGILLHQGRVAEMKTGEGKTLVATMPAYLNALAGGGVHIVTVNDYLAARDSQEMGKVYGFLGLSTGLIYSHQPKSEKKVAYAADITYGTNHEFGFDYLRDNMSVYKESLSQRGHAFAIVDEVDSILIDEARTPLIISGEGSKSTDLYGTADVLARSLNPHVVKEMDTKQDNDYREEYFYSEEFSEPIGYLSRLGATRCARMFDLSLENDFIPHGDGVMANLTDDAIAKLIGEHGFSEDHFELSPDGSDRIFSESGMRRMQKILGVSLLIDDKLGSAYITTIGKNKAIQFFSFEEADFVCTDKQKQLYSFTRSGISRAKSEFNIKESDLLFGEKDFVANEQARVTVFTKSGMENAIRYFGLTESDFVIGAKARTATLSPSGAEKLSLSLGLEKRDLIEDQKTGTFSVSKQADGKVKTRFNLDFTTDKASGKTVLTGKGYQRVKAAFSLSDKVFNRVGVNYELTKDAANAINAFVGLDDKAFIQKDKKSDLLLLSRDLAAKLINLSVLESRDVSKADRRDGVDLLASGAEKLSKFFSLELSEIKTVKDEYDGVEMLISRSGAEKIRSYFAFSDGVDYTDGEDGLTLTGEGHEKLAGLLGAEGAGAIAALTKQGALSVQKSLDFDYIVDEKARTAVLTASGIEKAEKFFGIQNLAAPECVELSKHVNIAIRAHGIMKRDVDYIVRDEAVVIVDTFTGRLMPGRRYNDGLHQAIEAKEHVKVQKESKTIATITYQNYFRMYKKLSGMTGTALTEENEFRDIYGLDVVEVPTNMPLIRRDYNDVIFRTRRAKIAAVIEQIKACYEKGQPVLVGTVSVDKSEELSLMLKKEKIPHNVLNAKQHEKEAEIVANAGTPGAVTISTNMAGRGTDIMLGGNPEHLAKNRMRKEGISEDVITVATGTMSTEDPEILEARALYKQYYKEFKIQIQPYAEKVREAGGLFIIGTERHESRRIDNQLRGRSGRQGDPGASRFYLSLEDDLLRLFSSDRIAITAARLGLPEDMPIDMKLVSGTIERAQKRIEASNFARRKHVLTYDDVMNEQRKVIYKQRSEILFEDDISARITDLIKSSVSESFDEFIGVENYEDARPAQFGDHYRNLLNGGKTLSYTEEEFAALDKEKLKEEFINKALALYRSKDEIAKATEGMPDDVMREIEKRVLLQNVDTKWMDHLEAMEELKGYVGLNSYAQRDPTVAYRIEGSDMFDEMIKNIREDTVTTILGGIPTMEGARRKEVAKVTGYGASSGPVKRRPVVSKRPNISRNAPCYCGSGRKYKDCCWAKDQKGD